MPIETRDLVVAAKRVPLQSGFFCLSTGFKLVCFFNKESTSKKSTYMSWNVGFFGFEISNQRYLPGIPHSSGIP